MGPDRPPIREPVLKPPALAHWLPLAACLLAALPAGWLAHRIVQRHAGLSAPARRAPAVVGAALAFAWAAAVTPPNLILVASLALAWTLGCLAAIDLACFRLPDALTLPLLALGLGAATVLPGRPWADHLLGAAAGWSALTILAWSYRRWRGFDGVGPGDAKLLGAAGAWLGWRPLPSVLLIACLVAFAWIAVRVLRRGRATLDDRLPFGPPLCLAIWVVWLHGPLIV